MAGRPPKSLLVRCQERSFRAREHHGLLGSEPYLPWPELAGLQRRYREAGEGFERRALAVEFQRRLLGGSELAVVAPMGAPAVLADLVAGLAVDELERIKLFFARFLRHSQGPLAGQPFVLAPFQERFVAEFYRRDEHGCRIYAGGLL